MDVELSEYVQRIKSSIFRGIFKLFIFHILPLIPVTFK